MNERNDSRVQPKHDDRQSPAGPLVSHAIGRFFALRKCWFSCIAVVAWIASVVALVVRLPFGAGTTDEAFYSAMTYGFTLGNKPYRDELALHQNAAILTVPFFRAYSWLFGTEGILLFNRWLYFAYITLCSVATFRLARKLTDVRTGAWAAALVVSFSYFNLFTLSYNTLGALGVFMGVLLATHALLENPVRHLIGAAFFFTTAAFAYPTFGVLAVLHIALVLLRLRQRTTSREFQRSLGVALLCTVVALLLAGGFLAWVSVDGIRRALEFSRAMGYGTKTLSTNVDWATSEVWAQRPFLIQYALLLLAFPIALKHLPRTTVALAVFVPIFWLLIYFRSAHAPAMTMAAMFLITFPVLCPTCLALAPGFAQRRLVLEQLWAPGVLSLLIVTFTSANGGLSASLGALPSVVAGLIALSALGSTVSPKASTAISTVPTAVSNHATAWLFASFSAAVLAAQIHTMFNGVYDFDADLALQTARVHRGPYRGALTTPAKARLLEAIDADLKSLEDPTKTIAVFDDFSVAYLSTRMRPRTFSHWVVWVFEPRYRQKITRETYEKPANRPDYVVLYLPRLKKANRFLQYLNRYEKVIDRSELGYVIERRIP